MKFLKPFLFSSYLLTFAVLFPNQIWAAKFNLGETVFVGLPATNIKDDAFIVGEVTRFTEQGDIQIKVHEFVHGHDYGAFCQPVAVVNPNNKSEYGDGWEVWQDTKRLDQRNLEFIVPAASVMEYRPGQHQYIERNNIWITFSRWISDAPILPAEKLMIAKEDAQRIGMGGLSKPLDLAISHRMAFYEDGWGRPYWPYESVLLVNKTLDLAQMFLDKDPQVNKLWRAEKRDKEQVDATLEMHFLMKSLDKVVKDAFYLLYEDLSKADADEVKALEEKLAKLGKKKI